MSIVGQNLQQTYSALQSAPTQQLISLLQNPNPGSAPSFLVAAELGRRERVRQAMQSPPSPQPTVAQQLVQQAIPPSPQGLGPPPSIAMSAPPASPPIDQGVGSLPYDANYADGGIVSFAGPEGSYVGVKESDLPFQERFLRGLESWKERRQYGAEEAGLSEDPVVGYKDVGYGQMKPVHASEQKDLFPQKEAPRKSDSLAGAKVEKVEQSTQPTQPTESIFDRLDLNTPTPGPSTDPMKMIREFKDKQSPLHAMADQPVPTPGALMAGITEARKAAGADPEAYEAKRTAEIEAETGKIGADKKQDMWLAAAKGFLGLAGGRNWQEGLTSGAKTFLEDAGKAVDRAREEERLVKQMKQAQEDRIFARKMGDADAVHAAEQREKDANKQLKIAAISADNVRESAALNASVQVLNTQISQAGADRRTRMNLVGHLYTADLTAKQNTQKMLLALGKNGQDAMTEIIKYGIVKPETQEKLRQSIFQDQDIDDKAKDFAKTNEYSDGNYVYVLPDGSLTKDKKSGKQTSAVEYFKLKKANEFKATLGMNLQTMNEVQKAIQSAGAPYAAGIASLGGATDIEEIPSFGGTNAEEE